MPARGISTWGEGQAPVQEDSVVLIHGDKVRWLFWLRWKILIRSFTRGSGRVSRIVGTVFLVLFGLPFVGGIAVGTYFAYRYLPPPANTEILFLLWRVLPLLEFSVNEGLDLSKLSLFPLTRAELMVSLLQHEPEQVDAGE